MRNIGLLAALAASLVAQNSAPNPYRTIENWAKLPEGRMWGSTSAVEVDRDGKSIWVAERCGVNSCAGKTDDPVLKFDSSGKLVKSFGSGMFLFPHGICVDKDGNVWVTDGQAKDGKGFQVVKFSPEGKVLMTLGKPGGDPNDPASFNQPNDVAIAPNGDIFVSEGHTPNMGSARIVKFSKDGKFIKQWGKHGSGPGELEVPHALGFDSRGRLFVGDRANNRIQIFDSEGKFLEEWKQFGRPSGIYIDKNDVIYVTDSESTDKQGYGYNPGWKRGIRIGSAKDGKVTAFIPDPLVPAAGAALPATSTSEGVAADAEGNVYGAEVGSKSLKKYVRVLPTEAKEDYFTTSDGIKIHYITLGARGSWVVLIHGYTDRAERMFFYTGVAQALAGNHRVVALDNRNHGLSDKPEPNGAGRAEDAIELMDHLKIQKAHIHGYSMGGAFTGQLLASHPERFMTAAFGGSGIQETDPKLRENAIAMDKPMPEPQGAEAAAFQRLREVAAKRAEAKGGATAAPTPLQIDLTKVTIPVLAINGEFDGPHMKTERMARELKNFQNVILPGKNHMSAIAVGGPMPPQYIESLVQFVNSHDVR